MTDSSSTPEKKSTGNTARAILIGFAVGLLVWFIVGNAQSVEIHFWVGSTHASLISVILIAAALGALIGIVASKVGKRRSAKRP